MNDWIAHLPVLLVVVPLLTAPLCVVVKSPRLARPLATAATFVTAIIAIGLVVWTSKQAEPISYALGGWPAPFGIEYRISKAAAWVAALVASVGALALLLGTRHTRPEVRDGHEHLFYAAYVLCLAGLLGMVATGDAFNVFVFLEISSLSTYTLVAMGPRRRAFTAAFNYLILGTLGGTFILLGIGMLFQVTGSLNGADIAARMAELHTSDGQDAYASKTAHVAFAFLVCGLSIKLAVFPLHQWLPGAYAESPSAVGAFLAGTATKVIYFQLMKVCLLTFGAAFVFESLHFGTLLTALSLVAMFVGSIAAVYQTSLKRLLAFSSIGQVGYLTLGLAFGSQAGVKSGLLHMGAHGVTKGALFIVVATMVAAVGSDRFDRIAGLGKRMPLVAFAFVLGGVSLIGVPGTVGFVSKWALLQAALGDGHPLIAAMILLSSLVAVVYVWRVVEVMYFREPQSDAPLRIDWGAFTPAVLLLLVTIVFGLYSGPVEALTDDAAAQLFGAHP